MHETEFLRLILFQDNQKRKQKKFQSKIDVDNLKYQFSYILIQFNSRQGLRYFKKGDLVT